MPKNQYATLSVPGSKKISVCSRRLGTRDRLAVIAVCNTEDVAEKIVDALNMQQGEIVKLETSATRALAAAREDMLKERRRADEYRVKLSDSDSKVRHISYELENAKRKISKLESALSASQAKAREDA